MSVCYYNFDTHKVVPKDAVVLDLDFIRFEPYGLPAVLGALRGNSFGGSEISRQIEKQTKPARIPEPGLYSLVVAGPKGWRKRWVRGPKGWTMVDADGPYLNWTHWDELEDPEPV